MCNVCIWKEADKTIVQKLREIEAAFERIHREMCCVEVKAKLKGKRAASK